MSALLQSLGSGFEGDAARRMDLDALLREGLPSPRSEAWKYTPLRALERRGFAPATPVRGVSATLLDSIASPRLVFINGAFDPWLSDCSTLPVGVGLSARDGVRNLASEDGVSLAHSDDAFARLNLLLSHTGTILQVAADTDVAVAVHLVFVGVPAESDQAWHLRHNIAIGANSRITLVEHHLASGHHAHLANTVLGVEMDANAQLTHVRVQREADAGTSLLRTDAVLGVRARYVRLDLELGAGLSRHELNVRLVGDGASLVANGVQLALGRRHLDARLNVEHVARDTACDLTWRALAAGRGRVVFHGGITIHAGADGSDARLSSKSLLLSDTAEIDAQPVLEIHADEVKAAHGATVGELDVGAIFYLRTRGLPEVDARRLLTAAFCREPLGIIRDDALRQSLVEAVDAALTELRAA